MTKKEKIKDEIVRQRRGEGRGAAGLKLRLRSLLLLGGLKGDVMLLFKALTNPPHLNRQIIKEYKF